MTRRRIAVIGAGITGAAAAHHLVSSTVPSTFSREPFDVVLFERSERVGGRIASTPFAGIESVDAGADAFLARVPHATGLAAAVGLADELVHPEPVGAAVWTDGLHDIPAGLVLGVPGNPMALARSGLLSLRGKARAALEPMLPRTSIAADSIGAYVRARFGNEVHERLVDALVGSIYAADTDRFSLAEIPQLAALTESRSLLLGARRVARRSAGTATAASAPIFATPRRGVGRLVEATTDAFVADGGTLRLACDPTVEPDGTGWRVADEYFDAVVSTAPAGDAPSLAVDRADVVMVTMLVPAGEFPDRLAGRSGYLVPKPVQRDVTAVSFGSQKWAHWRPPGGGEILRVSLGRDGAPVLHLDDDEIVERVLDDLHLHLGERFSPSEVRITRWPGAFAQYRPHHRRRVDEFRADLPPRYHVAGSSYDGIGVPACILSGKTFAERAAHDVQALTS